MKKQFLALLIACLLVMTFSICFAASKFSDTVNTKYDTAVEYLTNKKVVDGYNENGVISYKPGNPVTRAEFSKLVVEGLGLKKITDLPMLKFSDINLTDKKHWGYDWIKVAVENNIIVGYPDGTFGPDRTITFAECETMILRAMKLESAMTDKSWPNGYMNEASKQGLLNNVSYTNPNAAANRGEIAISLYNMVTKVEKQKMEDELAKKEAEQKAEKEAKENALDFNIVASTSSSKDTYYLKLLDDKTKYEIYSIAGKTKLTDSKVEDLENNVIGYKEGKNGLEVNVTYTPSSFDSAKVITKVDGSKITYKDKSTWDTSSTTLVNKYKLYTFIRVTASVNDDDEVELDKVAKLGLGLSSAKFVKNERVLVDDTNKVIVFLKGIDASETIKKGKINGSSVDTSDYEYGWVTATRSKSKTDYVKIGKTEYEVYSKSSDFEDDTFVVYTIQSEGDDYDVVKLVKQYGVYDLDGNANVVKSVSGGTKVTYGSTTVDFGTSSNLKKYEDYEVVEIQVKEASDGVLEVTDYDTGVDLEDVTFKAGDRFIIDTKNEVFAIFHGLSASNSYSKGKKQVVVNYTVKYEWASGTEQVGTLPSDSTVQSGKTHTVWNPSNANYTFTFKNKSTGTTYTAGKSITVSGNIVIVVTTTKVDTELERLTKAVKDAKAAYDAAKAVTAEKKSAMDSKEAAKTKAINAYGDAERAYQAAESSYNNYSGDDEEMRLKLKREYEAAVIALSEKDTAMDKAIEEWEAAQTAYNAALHDEEVAYQKHEDAKDALAAYVESNG